MDKKARGSQEDLLQAINVEKEYRSGVYLGTSFKAVDQISFVMNPGQLMIVAGESGCGKSTLAKMIMGYTPPSKGNIVYRGVGIEKYRGKAKKKLIREIQPVFQDPFQSFNPFKKVLQPFELTCRKFNLAETKKERKKLIGRVIEMVALNPSEVEGKYSHEFSGGQLQRLSIARALLTNPSLLVADEPVSMVDASARVGILSVFTDLVNGHDMSILYITHDLATAYYTGVQTDGDILVMFRGEMIEMGKVEEVLSRPAHPYTELLMESLPEADPEKRWTTEIRFPSLELKEYQVKGCKFARRCPGCGPNCLDQKPVLQILEDRYVRCKKPKHLS